MTELFYVLYSPSQGQYLDGSDLPVPFEKAERYSPDHRASKATLEIARENVRDARWVGPCKEGETP